MARAHGRNARLYVSVASGGSASPLLYAASWTLNLSTNRVKVTAFGDTNEQYVAGLPDSQLTYSGFMDDTAGTALISAAQDGVARKWYLYPFASDSKYWFSTSFFDASFDASTEEAVTMSGTASAATTVGSNGLT